jgi:transposase-like protein
MVAAVRRGASLRAVARRFRVGVATVQLWVQRARHQRLDRVDWGDRPPIPRTIRRTDPAVADLVLTVRRTLKETRALGECGAAAIRRELLQRESPRVPSLRTMGRILARRGALDARHRVRRRPPPLGWYLPEVASAQAEVDSVDIVEGLVIEGGPHVEVLHVISLHGGFIGSWPRPALTARVVTDALLEHWQAWGLPTDAPFDHDTRFQGPHQHPDALGRVIRLCVSLKVIPVFAPLRETGFHAAIERSDGRWQAKVWQRCHYESLPAQQAQWARSTAA